MNLLFSMNEPKRIDNFKMSSGEDIILPAVKFLTSETENICRLCFSSTADSGVSMQDCVVIQIRDEETASFLDMFHGLGVSVDPSLPQVLCVECATLTTNSYIFHQLYQYSNQNWELVVDQLNRSLEPSENIGSNSHAIYLMIGTTNHVVQAGCKQYTLKDKKTILKQLEECLKTKDPVHKSRRQRTNVICEECGEKLPSKCHLMKHMRVHSHTKYPCPQCPKVFSLQSQLDHHAERVHFPKKRLCPKCPKKFSTEKMLTNHEKLHHIPATCKMCSILFPSKNELRLHLDKHDMNICPHCSKSFANKNSFKLHLKICGTDEKYPKFFCDICNKGYIRKNGLRTHIKTDHGFGNVLACDWCGKKYDAISKLRNHIVKHTKEKNFHCEHCGGKFVTQAALVYHVRLHTGERPFPCEMCNESFLSASRRMEHKRRKHLGPTKECHICHMKFFTKHQLTRHVERHFNPHSKLFVPQAEEPYMAIANSISKGEEYPNISKLLSI